MRVCLVGSHFEPYIGGIEVYMGELARGLQERGIEVVIACTTQDAGAGSAAAVGLAVRRVPLYGEVGGVGWPGRLLRSTEFDLVHFNGFSRPLLVRMLLDARGLPWVITPQGGVDNGESDPVPLRRGVKRAADALLARRLLKRAGAIICVTEHEARPLVDRLQLDPARVLVWPNFPPRRTLDDAVARSGRLLVLARLDRGKRISDLLAALRDPALPPCDVAGPTGDAERELRVLASTLPSDRVQFLGAVTGVAKERLLASAKALVLCSEREGHSVAALEALAAGTPVVASAGAAAGLGEGVLTYPTGDVDALRAALTSLDRPDVAAALAAGVERARSTLVDPTEYLDRLVTLYERLVR